MSELPDDDIRERVSRLEAKMENAEKAIDAMDERIDKFLNNELKHIDERITGVEGRNGGISAADWTKIMIAIISAMGALFVAIINIRGG